MDDLLPRLARVIQLMTKQLHNLNQKDLMTLLKSEEVGEFFKTLSKLEIEYDIDDDDQFFTHYMDELIKWQNDLPGGKINVKKDFIKAYKRMDKFDREEVKNKVLLHQTTRIKNILKEYFRLLDASIDANKILPIEAFSQHLGLTLDELAEHLDRINWEDEVIEPETVKEDADGKLKPPIHIERDFLKFYHQQDKLMKGDIQNRVTQGIQRKVRANIESLFAWIDMNTKEGDNIPFETLVKQSNMHPQELIRYLDRINWGTDY